MSSLGSAELRPLVAKSHPEGIRGIPGTANRSLNKLRPLYRHVMRQGGTAKRASFIFPEEAGKRHLKNPGPGFLLETKRCSRSGAPHR